MDSDLAVSQFLHVNVEEQLSGKHSQGRNNVLNQKETNSLCGRRRLMKDPFFTQSSSFRFPTKAEGQSFPGVLQAFGARLEWLRYPVLRTGQLLGCWLL